MTFFAWLRIGLTVVDRYQIHFRVLNASNYGAAQHRLRVVFVAARQGYPLPAFPIPTHTAPQDSFKRKLPIGTVLCPVVRYFVPDIDPANPEVGQQWAPHHGVTVVDAISDLVRAPMSITV